MASSCIPRVIAEKIKAALRSGEINISDIYNMSSEMRRAKFESFTSPELAQKINTNFEKAMVSKQKDALTEWAKNTFTEKEKLEEPYNRVLEKINKLEDAGVLNETASNSFLTDLVADRLGVSLTKGQIKNITNIAEQLQAEFAKVTEDGIPSVEYWKKRKEMDDYLKSLVPSSVLKVATSTIGRGAMLFSVKSPLTNIISNTVHGAVQGFERRIASNTYLGINNDFALNYVKKVNKIYQESGFDISRMEDISAGQVRLGEEVISAQGPGKIREIGRWYEDIVFKQLMGAPDVASSSVAFADSVNLASTKIAKGDKSKALAIFKDAVKLRPETINGEIVRAQAIADARYSTYTNKGGYSDLAMAIRTALNKTTGDLRLGDQIMPFVKTPANVVQAGVDASGVGFFKGWYKLPEALKEMKFGNKEPMADVVRLFTRSGLGLTLAAVLVQATDPEDFIGEYDVMTQKGRDLVKATGATYNSVKFGDKWISLDYLGPLAAPFIGMMYARKYGDNLPQKIAAYGRGVLGQAAKIPGLRDFGNLVESVNRAVKEEDLQKTAGRLTDETISWIRSRTIPAIVNDFAKGMDVSVRDVEKGQLSRTISGIPWLRETLPKKINQLTGEFDENNGFILTILFGSRVKKVSENVISKELSRLYDNNTAPVISDIGRASKRFKELQGQLSKENFRKAEEYFAKIYSSDIKELIESDVYSQMSDEDKKDEWNSIRRKAINDTLDEFGYVSP